jgi:predicted ferric reductase
MSRPKSPLWAWGVLGAALVAAVWAIAAAALSPLLAWREPIYILGGFAGIVGLAALLFQPLLAGGRVPGLSLRRARLIHRGGGVLLVFAVLTHVGGLWLTSPPDVMDALLFVSPTPFAVWGVLAMWSVFAAALLVALRRALRMPPAKWRMAHRGLALVTVGGTALHALLIEGAMEPVSKAVLCAFVVGVTLWVIARPRPV